MERSVEIDTGESVTFQYELAGLGSRFLAVFIDLVVQVLVVTLVIIVLATVNPVLAPQLARFPAHVRKTLGAVAIGAVIVALFLLFIGYFIIFEWRWGGRTLGKRMVGIRVVRDGGFPVDFFASATRNLVRLLEFSFGFYTISAISALISPMNRRLGDLAAGTLVVRSERIERVPMLSSRVSDDPALAELDSSERELIARYADRRAGLSKGSRAPLAAHIAARIRPKLSASFNHLDDDALLEHLARVNAVR